MLVIEWDENGNAKINKPEKMKKVHASARIAKSTSS
jgi:hypothetical protein